MLAHTCQKSPLLVIFHATTRERSYTELNKYPLSTIKAHTILLFVDSAASNDALTVDLQVYLELYFCIYVTFHKSM